MHKKKNNWPFLWGFLGLLLSRWRSALAVITLGLWLLSTMTVLWVTPNFDPERKEPGFDSGAFWSEGWWRYADAASPNLYSLSVTADGRSGWAVGDGGAILGTEDGGQTWQPLGGEMDFKVETLQAVHFVDARLGWAAGSTGTIIATSDGGRAWQPQPSDTTFWLEAIQFLDAQRGWAVGRSGTIVATVDGGRTWKSQNSGTEVDFSAVQFLDAQRGWVVGRAGTILVTADGGRTWKAQSSGTQQALYAVYFLDAQNGWTVGDGGTILATADGGQSWKPQVSGVDDELDAVQFADAYRGWAVGENGAIRSTSDGGQTWQAQTSGTKGTLRDVRFFTAYRGWALGEGGRLLVTSDGGATWNRQFAIDNRLPDWYWTYSVLSLPLFLYGLWGWRMPAAMDPIMAMLSSDRPQRGQEPDALGSKSLAWAISRFLRHRRTEPPLTIALNAPWGGGKSSLMNWLREDLQRFGFRPVWFNAWHYETQAQMFPALIEAVRRQAVPGWLSLSGIKFRLRLLGRRASDNPLLAGLLLVALLFPAGYLYTHGDTVRQGWNRIWVQTLQSTFPKPSVVAQSHSEDRAGPTPADRGLPAGAPNPGKSVQSASFGGGWQHLFALFPFLAPLFGLVKAMQSFKEPTQYFADWFKRTDPDKTRRETAVRAQFAHDFRTVTASLDRTLVIFIDDLDRCQPKNVCEIMETVNFLVSEGACHIVLGIWREGVERAIGLGFREAAEEFARIEQLQGGTEMADDAEIRRRYGQLYLEKLINIWVTVPCFETGAVARMLTLDRASETGIPFPFARDGVDPKVGSWAFWKQRVVGWLDATLWVKVWGDALRPRLVAMVSYGREFPARGKAFPD